MENIEIVTKKNIAYILILIAIYLISMQITGLRVEEGVSPTYINFYHGLAMQGLFGGVFVVLFLFFRANEFQIVEGRRWKIILHGAVIAAIFITSINAIQLYPVPRASVSGFQLSEGTELYTSSVIPGVIEDINYNFVLPLIFVIAMVIFAGNILKVDVGKKLMIVFILIACLISSVGYNVWLIPGFTSAHIQAYGENPQAFFGAFVFSYSQSMVNLMTGWFVPVAHIVHNYMIAYGQIYGIGVGEFAIT